MAGTTTSSSLSKRKAKLPRWNATFHHTFWFNEKGIYFCTRYVSVVYFCRHWIRFRFVSLHFDMTICMLGWWCVCVNALTTTIFLWICIFCGEVLFLVCSKDPKVKLCCWRGAYPLSARVCVILSWCGCWFFFISKLFFHSIFSFNDLLNFLWKCMCLSCLPPHNHCYTRSKKRTPVKCSFVMVIIIIAAYGCNLWMLHTNTRSMFVSSWCKSIHFKHPLSSCACAIFDSLQQFTWNLEHCYYFP